ncbi:MAG: YitT family protein [Bacilli bacterium]|nr:YitT family protein [Bacilli bacterium]
MEKRKLILKNGLEFLMFLVGVSITAIAFNLFFVPNNYISYGLTGISVILSHVVEITPVTVLFFGNMFLIGLSIVLLGMDRTSKSIFGALIFTLITYLTEDINTILNVSLENPILSVIASGVLFGVGEGLTFKAGYSSGGTSILALILNEYIKKPIGTIMNALGVAIIIAGGFTFGLENIMYSIIIVCISTYLINKITIGISDSKMFLIYTSKEIEVIDYIMNTFHNGVTKITSKGVYSNKKKNLLMCVVPSDKYTQLLKAIKLIDQNAFVSVSNCYEVYGGTKRNKIPFIYD